MKRVKKSWKPILLGMVLATMLFEAAGARPLGGPLKVVTVSAAECIPTEDWDWRNLGSYLQMNSGVGTFACPVHFPVYGTKRVRIIKVYVRDNTGSGGLSAMAWRTTPAGGAKVAMTNAMFSSDSGADPQVLTMSWGQISNEVVTQSHGMYVSVYLGAASIDLKLYGFRIWYI